MKAATPPERLSRGEAAAEGSVSDLSPDGYGKTRSLRRDVGFKLHQKV